MIITLLKAPAALQPMTAPDRPSDTSSFEPHLQAAPTAPQVLALLAVFAGTSGALSTLSASPVLRSILLMLFLLTGVGSAILCWLELPIGATVAGVIGLSLAAVIAVATAMVWLQTWYPAPSCLALSLIVVSTGLIRLWTFRGRWSAREIAADGGSGVGATATRPPRLADFIGHAPWYIAHAGATATRPRRLADFAGSPARYIATALPFSALAIWLLALPLLRENPGGQYGLLATRGGLLLITATVLAVTGLFVAIVVSRMVAAAFAIVATIVTARVTVALITEVPNYVWTYKHIGVADFILKDGSLPSLAFDIYAPWPGFFAGAAWFASITGVDLITIAQWFAPLIDTLAAVMVVALALGLRLSLRTAFASALVVQVLNWVGQDYFAPQAIAFVLAIGVLALLAHSRDCPAAGYISLPIFAALVPTHQLTPVWICATAVAMGLFAQMQPRWLALPYLLLLATYVISRRSVIDQYGWFSGFDPFANSATVVNNPGSEGRMFTTSVEQGLALSVWFLAAACFVIIWRKMPKRWAAGVIAFSSMLLLFAQNYGGEAILRVYLFSLPGCAVVLSAFLGFALSLARRWHRWGSIGATWLVVVGFAVAGLQGYFGSWSYVTITRSQLELSRSMLATTPSNTLLILPEPAGLPTRVSADYVRHAAVNPWFDNQPDTLEDALRTGRPLAEILEWLESDVRATGHRRLYIFLPRQVWAYDEYTHYFKPGALELLLEQLSTRPGWTTVPNDANTLIFVYSG
jgi:hypothetical protein